MQKEGFHFSEEHIGRIDKALHFIEDNLEKPLSLELIAQKAFYSPFHFHRLFKLITKESLTAYINRKRIENAASILLHRQEVTISEISIKYGFNSNSSFTRTFKKYYGVSPSAFRESSPGKYSKIGKVESKNGQVMPLFESYLHQVKNLINWMNMNANIKVHEVEDMQLAYITQIGDNGLSNTFERLIKWATPKGMMNNPEVKLLTVYHDSFKFTDHDKVRMSVAIKLEELTSVSGEVGLMELQPGKCIVGSFEIGVADFEKAWTSLFLWMNENGYIKADITPFEIYHNNFNEHPEKKFIVDMFIPIQ